MASITLRGVDKTYPNGQAAARGLDLEIADGELMVLVGPSGSGKSTALRMIAGLETPSAGQVLIGGQDVTAVPPQERDLAMVFQSYALYPHRTVRQNLAFPLRMQRLDRRTIAERIGRVAGSLGLVELLERTPAQLSGGQRQRVALGRALVREPRAFLLDEPLSNLDPRLRVQTRTELALLHRRLGATMVYVTHDQEEAMTLGDRIAVMRDGALQQVGPPLELYRRPVNAFVAGFIGSPSMNFFRGDVVASAAGARLRAPGLDVALDAVPPAAGPVLLGIRPEDVRLVPVDDAAAARGRVEVVEPLGSVVHLHLRLEGSGAALVVVAPPDTAADVDQVLGVRFPPERLHLFDAATERRR